MGDYTPRLQFILVSRIGQVRLNGVVKHFMVDPELVVELQDLGLGQLREIVLGLRLGAFSGLDGRVEPLELVLLADDVGQVALLHHVQDLGCQKRC